MEMIVDVTICRPSLSATHLYSPSSSGRMQRRGSLDFTLDMAKFSNLLYPDGNPYIRESTWFVISSDSYEIIWKEYHWGQKLWIHKREGGFIQHKCVWTLRMIVFTRWQNTDSCICMKSYDTVTPRQNYSTSAFSVLISWSSSWTSN